MTSDDTTWWISVQQRRKELDGTFFFAVKTTGIYCKPSCPSRRPNKENIVFFSDTQQARDAGYRACSRCHPDTQGSEQQMIVQSVCKIIEANLERKLTLSELSNHVGVSKFHLQRTFKSHTGLTPREYANQCKLKLLKQELAAGKSVTEAIYEAGYSSSSRVYETSNQQLGMTPSLYAKRGKDLRISYAFSDSPLGLLLLAGTSRGICFLQFGDSADSLLKQLSQEFSAAELAEDESALTNWLESLYGYFYENKRFEDTIALDLEGSDFQRTVWQYLQKIPPGETRTYTEVASAIGKPDAIRAVASACAANKVALVIPCHRVVRKDGNLAGYRWGLNRKQGLLKAEQRSRSEEAYE